MPKPRRKNRTETALISVSWATTEKMDMLTIRCNVSHMRALSVGPPYLFVLGVEEEMGSHAIGPIARYRRYENTFC